MLRGAFAIVIMGIIAGAIAAFTDAGTHKISGEAIYVDRMDRLIRAVELDWGR